MGSIKSFRELLVWQKAIELAEAVYIQTRKFPKEELYALTSQMRRAVVSIPSNIAEGHSRNSTKEFIQFLAIAKGSLAELETRIEIATRLSYISPEQKVGLIGGSEEIGKMISGLVKSLREKSE